MSNNKKIVSKRVESEIPQWLQNMLCYLIESMIVSEKERVQVFDLSRTFHEGNWKQKIIHSQDSPAYRSEHIVTALDTVNAKIIVIHDENYCVMLMG